MSDETSDVMSDETSDVMSDVWIRVQGACGRITLNRPHALNALTLEMVVAIDAALRSWVADESVGFVLLDGAGERGLCAGGDIRAVYNATITNTRHIAVEFFRQEYRLNYLIACYAKPYVVLMDGIVMGGGIGISAHGSHRVVTERSQLAMPETGIGFVPDVGATHLLGMAPGEFGTYLGLSGARIGAADAIACGLADSMVTGENLNRLSRDLEQCSDAEGVEEVLRAYSTQATPGMALEQREWIDRCFALSTVEDIFAAIAQESSVEAVAALQDLQKKSPTSLKLALRALRKGREFNDLGRCLQQEYRLAQVCVREHDFAEGVRAAIIDKDRKPRWSPQRLQDVTPEALEKYFSESNSVALDLTP